MKTRPIVMAMKTPFDNELTANIRATILRLRRSGTVSMSMEKLKMVVTTPRTTDGAPVGGNLEWQYSQRFSQAVSDCFEFRQFVGKEAR